MRFSELVQTLQVAPEQTSLVAYPDRDPEITAIASVEQAAASTISYIDGGQHAALVKTTGASVLVLPDDESLRQQANDRGIAWISFKEPRVIFAYVVRLFYRPFQPEPSIHPTAVIDPSAQIGQDVYIGPHAVISAQAKVGDRACIHANVTLYPQVQIGERTVLHANCVIHERSQIGADCVVHSGAVIGSEGFGFVPTKEGWLKVEQTGYTVLEDGVEVGCNTTIDRAAIGETRIGRGTKIDNQVHIAHGCKIGQHCALAGQVGMTGGVILGDRVMLAGQVGIGNQATLGDGVVASAKAGIHNDIKAGEIVSGYPAMPHKAFLRTAAVYTRLPEIYQQLKQLKRLLADKEQG